MPSGNDNPETFSNQPKEEVEAIASKGGQASHEGSSPAWILIRRYDDTRRYRRIDADLLQRDIASKGGQASSGSFEPGSDKASEAGRKGGSK
ncbi:hypothetical protein PLICBS_010182 [Purpureocillium lilacinum]|uniref:uncharacterized protein n=1 Tax=Purpureocillium lilacinum TaxID=33203 RepID=UPI002085F498|nr:hypothetical protein PLICBS_010182 [Purpureocillium lilacinum]